VQLTCEQVLTLNFGLVHGCKNELQIIHNPTTELAFSLTGWRPTTYTGVQLRRGFQRLAIVGRSLHLSIAVENVYRFRAAFTAVGVADTLAPAGINARRANAFSRVVGVWFDEQACERYPGEQASWFHLS
jgi:hypothetical protein